MESIKPDLVQKESAAILLGFSNLYMPSGPFHSFFSTFQVLLLLSSMTLFAPRVAPFQSCQPDANSIFSVSTLTVFRGLITFSLARN